MPERPEGGGTGRPVWFSTVRPLRRGSGARHDKRVRMRLKLPLIGLMAMCVGGAAVPPSDCGRVVLPTPSMPFEGQGLAGVPTPLSIRGDGGSGGGACGGGPAQPIAPLTAPTVDRADVLHGLPPLDQLPMPVDADGTGRR
jgi:hypothetical protein